MTAGQDPSCRLFSFHHCSYFFFLPACIKRTVAKVPQWSSYHRRVGHHYFGSPAFVAQCGFFFIWQLFVCGAIGIDHLFKGQVFQPVVDSGLVYPAGFVVMKRKGYLIGVEPFYSFLHRVAVADTIYRDHGRKNRR